MALKEIGSVKLHGLDNVMDILRSLPKEIASKNGSIFLPALRKGARITANKAKENVRRIVLMPDESDYVSTGKLEQSITTVRGRNPKRSGAAESVNVIISRSKKFDYDKLNDKEKKLRTVATGRYLEFGTSKRAPTPFMLPAFMQTKEMALSAIVKEIKSGLDKMVKKVAARNRNVP